MRFFDLVLSAMALSMAAFVFFGWSVPDEKHVAVAAYLAASVAFHARAAGDREK